MLLAEVLALILIPIQTTNCHFPTHKRVLRAPEPLPILATHLVSITDITKGISWSEAEFVKQFWGKLWTALGIHGKKLLVHSYVMTGTGASRPDLAIIRPSDNVTLASNIAVSRMAPMKNEEPKYWNLLNKVFVKGPSANITPAPKKVTVMLTHSKEGCRINGCYDADECFNGCKEKRGYCNTVLSEAKDLKERSDYFLIVGVGAGVKTKPLVCWASPGMYLHIDSYKNLPLTVVHKVLNVLSAHGIVTQRPTSTTPTTTKSTTSTTSTQAIAGEKTTSIIITTTSSDQATSDSDVNPSFRPVNGSTDLWVSNSTTVQVDGHGVLVPGNSNRQTDDVYAKTPWWIFLIISITIAVVILISIIVVVLLVRKYRRLRHVDTVPPNALLASESRSHSQVNTASHTTHSTPSVSRKKRGTSAKPKKKPQASKTEPTIKVTTEPTNKTSVPPASLGFGRKRLGKTKIKVRRLQPQMKQFSPITDKLTGDEVTCASLESSAVPADLTSRTDRTDSQTPATKFQTAKTDNFGLNPPTLLQPLHAGATAATLFTKKFKTRMANHEAKTGLTNRAKPTVRLTAKAGGPYGLATQTRRAKLPTQDATLTALPDYGLHPTKRDVSTAQSSQETAHTGQYEDVEYL